MWECLSKGESRSYLITVVGGLEDSEIGDVDPRGRGGGYELVHTHYQHPRALGFEKDDGGDLDVCVF